MIIKLRRLEDHAKAFDVLDKAGMKLNSDKCTFGVKAGKFLSFMCNGQALITRGAFWWNDLESWKNSRVKRANLREILGWVTSWEVLHSTYRINP